MKHVSALKGFLLWSILSILLLIPKFSQSQTYPAPYNVFAIFNNDVIPIVEIYWQHDADSVIYFIVERDGYQIGTTLDHQYIDYVPAFIDYCYNIYAVYNTGTSAPGGPACCNANPLLPEMSVLPEYFEYAVPVNDSIEYTLSIINSGEYELQYDIIGFTPYASPPGFITIDDLGIGWVDPYGSQKDIPVKWSSAGYGPGTYYQDIVVLGNDPDNLVDIIPNIMHVGPWVTLEGDIVDASNNEALYGVEINAGLHYDQTDTNGHYSFQIPENSTLDITYSKSGYDSLVIPLTSGSTNIVIDTSLVRITDNIPWVLAATDCHDSDTAFISWPAPGNTTELIYDDNFCTDFHAWDFPGGEHAVKFTPAGYPATIFGGSFYVGRGVYPDGNWLNTTVTVLAYDEGPDGMPGSVLDSVTAIISDYGWVECFFANDAQIDSGNFFISVVQENMYPDTPPIGVDEYQAQFNYSYSKHPLGTWDTASHRNYMIRAIIEYPSEVGISYYTLAWVDNVDPNLGPQSGDLVIYALLLENTYVDDIFFSVPDGWYAYAVQTTYSNGDVSDWTYSNIIGHDMGKIVEFIADDCNGNPVDSLNILLMGQDYPYIFSIETDTSPIIFDCVWKGIYTINVSAPGFDPIEFDTEILADTSFYFMFDSTSYLPVSNLWVDTISTTAYWDPPSDTSALIDYSVYLDGQYSGNTDSTYFQFTGLPFDQYLVCVEANYTCGPSAQVCTYFGGGYIPSPGWITGDSIGSDILLTWYMDTTGFSDALIGFKLYRDSAYFKYIPYVIGQDTFTHLDTNLLPMCYDYHVSAFYDLETYGYPMQFGDSEFTGPAEVCLVAGGTLPVFEDWSSGSFGSFWTGEGNWRINGQYGNPMPSAEFTWDPVFEDYQFSLTTDFINGVYLDSTKQEYLDGKFMLNFDLKLDDNLSTGAEHFKAEIWSQGTWNMVFAVDNSDGSFDWTTESIDVTEYALGYVFKIRFLVEGESTMNILSWFVDNIEVYHYCPSPSNLLWDPISPNMCVLTWHSPSEGNKGMEGYNLYLSFNWEPYQYLDHTTDTSYIYQFTEYGDYYFYVTALYESCESDGSNEIWIQYYDPIGIDDMYGSEAIKISPVPSRDLINVESTIDISRLCLLDLSGRELYCQENIHEKQHSINVSAYDPGVYLLRIDTEQGRAVKKIIIAR